MLVLINNEKYKLNRSMNVFEDDAKLMKQTKHDDYCKKNTETKTCNSCIYEYISKFRKM